MFIVTYTTHKERYYNVLLESCKRYNIELKNIGMGKSWKGFKEKSKEFLKYCKSLQENDIVCFIDGFDTIALSNVKELESKFRKLKQNIVCSKAGNTSAFISKYIQQKIFTKCNSYRVNSGMIIGYNKQLQQYLEKYVNSDIEDDQIFLIYECQKNNNIYVDNDNILFYNYCETDTYTVVNNRLYVNNNYPCFVSGPLCKNMNGILDQLNYKNLPNIQCNNLQRLSIYISMFNSEIVFLISVAFVLFCKQISNSKKVIIIILMLMTLFEYELYVKHLRNVKKINKFFYILVDLLHNATTIMVVSSFIYFARKMIFFETYNKSNYNELLMLNSFYFIIIVLFIFFKRCFLTLIGNRILGINELSIYVPIYDRINRIYKDTYDIKYIKNDNSSLSIKWLNGNFYMLIILIIINIYVIYSYKILRKVVF